MTLTIYIHNASKNLSQYRKRDEATKDMANRFHELRACPYVVISNSNLYLNTANQTSSHGNLCSLITKSTSCYLQFAFFFFFADQMQNSPSWNFLHIWLPFPATIQVQPQQDKTSEDSLYNQEKKLMYIAFRLTL